MNNAIFMSNIIKLSAQKYFYIFSLFPTGHEHYVVRSRFFKYL